MNKFLFNPNSVIANKRFSFNVENVLVNGRSLFLVTLQGFFSTMSSFFIYNYFDKKAFNYFANKKLLKQELRNLVELGFRANALSAVSLKLVGTGYKSIAPKKYSFKFLGLRLGFAAAEIGYSLNDARVKMRARKQKIILMGYNKFILNNYSKQLQNLKFTNVYTGKGIRNAQFFFSPKLRKQQQRSK